MKQKCRSRDILNVLTQLRKTLGFSGHDMKTFVFTLADKMWQQQIALQISWTIFEAWNKHDRMLFVIGFWYSFRNSQVSGIFQWARCVYSCSLDHLKFKVDPSERSLSIKISAFWSRQAGKTFPRNRSEPEMETKEDLRRKLHQAKKEKLDITAKHNAEVSTSWSCKIFVYTMASSCLLTCHVGLVLGSTCLMSTFRSAS